MNNIDFISNSLNNSKDSECDLIESSINNINNNNNNNNSVCSDNLKDSSPNNNHTAAVHNKNIQSQKNPNSFNVNEEEIVAIDSSSSNSDMTNSKKKKSIKPIANLNKILQHGYVSSGIGKASFIHALIVIFLEFFAWGLLTDQVITVLNETFPDSTFLANGLIHGLKGILSFLSAPLIGAMSDIWGRKVFLLITVFFTCLPIPLMRINTMWYFAMISISGLFAVTFSVVFAYVADVTDESNRTTAYGLVSATFAASLITSPALGSYLSRFYSENFVIALATAIAIFDLFFILVAVPESLPEKLREKSKTISWENIDPFKSLKVVFDDRTISLLCVTVFLSYLPEAGQYSCFFVYLKLIVGFSQQEVAYFIAYVGILSCIAQAAVLVILIKYFGSKQSIIIGLTFQVLQLASYGFAAQQWLIWFSGLLAALSSIGYPAISAFISNQSHVDQQGVSQGMVTGIRGLCNGIGPALYGLIFWIFRVNLNEANNNNNQQSQSNQINNTDNSKLTYAQTHLLPGPPFLFGSVLALLAIFVTCLIPSSHKSSILLQAPRSKDKTTIVKLGNSSNTYNRTSSSSSMVTVTTKLLDANNGGGSNKNLVSADMISHSPTGALLQEKEYLLLDSQNDEDEFINNASTAHRHFLLSNSDSITSNSTTNINNLITTSSVNINNNQNNNNQDLYNLLNSNCIYNNETGQLTLANPATTESTTNNSSLISMKAINKISNNLNELNNANTISNNNSNNNINSSSNSLASSSTNLMKSYLFSTSSAHHHKTNVD